MHYVLLCYHSEKVVGGWSQAEDDAVMARLSVVHEQLIQEGKLGPVARLMPTTAATTLRKGKEHVVLDGPFAETKEQLLGFYVVDCKDLEDALSVARRLGDANPDGAYEIRPIMLMFDAGSATPAASRA